MVRLRIRSMLVLLVLYGGIAFTAASAADHGLIVQQTRAQEEAEPRGIEEEIRFQSGNATIHGTLFWPATAAGDFPAVVILAGSDRSQRGPLRIRLARYLAANQVAALVYDSPGTGTSTGSALLQTRDERVTEALHAVGFLRNKPGIRADAVGLLGGSEGADIAIMAAAREPLVSFVIAVSGAMGVSVLDRLRYSAEKKGYDEGLDAEEILKAMTFKEVAFVLLSGVDIVEWPLIESRSREWNDDSWTTLVELAKLRVQGALTNPQKESLLVSLRQVVQHFSGERWFATVDPDGALQRAVNMDADMFFRLLESGRYSRDWDTNLRRDAADIQCPILAVWGEQDSFLPPHQSATRLTKFLADSGHADHQIRIFPNASHFLTTAGPDTDFIPGYLELMTEWLNTRFPATRQSGR
ncbi:MAG: alpha/beta hydrolase [Pirellulaceae bacterium]